MGGLYTLDWQQDFGDLYCEECGDSDWEIGKAETRVEAKKLLKTSKYYDLYGKEYCEQFLDENFGKIRKKPVKKHASRKQSATHD